MRQFEFDAAVNGLLETAMVLCDGAPNVDSKVMK